MKIWANAQILNLLSPLVFQLFEGAVKAHRHRLEKELVMHPDPVVTQGVRVLGL
jgi:hypothetical protein